MDQKQEKFSWPDLVRRLSERSTSIDLGGMAGASPAFLAASVLEHFHRPTVVVTATEKAADQMARDIEFFIGDREARTAVFPSYNLLPFKLMAYHNDTSARRIGLLFQLVEEGGPQVVVISVQALMQKLLPKRELIGFAELLAVGEEIDREALIHQLFAGGYTRVVMVEEPGDFCLRGGILDIFSPLSAYPLRVEFFGDTVDSLRQFDPASQRTVGTIDEAVLLPAREAILDKSRLHKVLGRIRTRASEMELPVSKVRQLVQRIKDEGLFPGLEGLLPLIYSQLDTFFDYLSDQSRWILVDPASVAAAANEFQDRIVAQFESACEAGQICTRPQELFLSPDQVTAYLDRQRPLRIRPFALYDPADSPSQGVSVMVSGVDDTADMQDRLQRSIRSETPFQPLSDWMTDHLRAGRNVLLAARSAVQQDRLVTICKSYGPAPQMIDAPLQAAEGKGRVFVCQGILSAGFQWPDRRLAVLTDVEIFGLRKAPRTRPRARPAAELLTVEDLKQGDLVVHDDHGIGRYEGLIKLDLEGTVNDFLLIVYQGDDKLYMPVERMGRVQKYMGVDGMAPVLDKMGGKSWQRVKSKIKRSAEKIAGELLKLYATRKVRQGHAFGDADTDFKDFEAGFEFAETADQAKAIEEVLDDMRQSVPMDRLVCGDVGYGKTEVALRAAFLAVSEARQVAVLVPTTVLAEQHAATFIERFARYPVNIASLNRFRRPAEQRKIVAGIKDGTVDIVIGTHRLLQKDVAFKNLGLLVLDEEQRFGVKHKERIKSLRATVDVLTMTATPIPRTLHLSLLGIRDISVIATPPEQRRAIATYVAEYDDGIIRDAIEKELHRGGQIFFVHNNINTIDRMAARLQSLVPAVRLAVAHGRMEERQLEKVMLSFMNRRIDMLVCTTIIESGLDIATANTMLINRADRFGLAQIYQLRGRVGRSDEQAYAYLFIPPETTLSRDAQKRLKVLMEHNDLGAGFQIAMNDLKIRGGGTILGASQSGHIAAVGYDMFLKLMETSIAELKGEPVQEPLEPEIHLPVSAYLPESYIPDIDQRLSLYRRLSKVEKVHQIAEIKSEIQDRYGKMPDPAGHLLVKMMLRLLAIRAGCARLDLVGEQLSLNFSEIHQKRPFGIVDMIGDNGNRYRFTPEHVFKARLIPGSANRLLSQTRNILQEIARHVNDERF